MVGIFTILYLFSVCVSVVLCQGVGEKVCVCVCAYISILCSDDDSAQIIKFPERKR